MGEEQGQAKQKGVGAEGGNSVWGKKPFTASAFPVNQIANILVQAQSKTQRKKSSANQGSFVSSQDMSK